MANASMPEDRTKSLLYQAMAKLKASSGIINTVEEGVISMDVY